MTPLVYTGPIQKGRKRPTWIAYQLTPSEPKDWTKVGRSLSIKEETRETEYLVTATRLKHRISIAPHKDAHNPEYPPPAFRISQNAPTGAVDIILEGRCDTRRSADLPQSPHRNMEFGVLWRSPSTLIRRAVWFAELNFATFFLKESWACLSDALTLWAAHSSTIPDELVKTAERADKCRVLSERAGTKHESCTALKHGVNIMIKLSKFIEEEEEKKKLNNRLEEKRNQHKRNYRRNPPTNPAYRATRQRPVQP